MSLFKKLSLVDERTKLAVYGWMREVQETLRIRATPDMIIAICILFFKSDEIFEIFDTESIELSSDQKSIKKLKKDWLFYHSYGRNQIISTTKGQYEWTLSVKSVTGWLFIGISSSTDTKQRFETMTGWYVFGSGGSKSKIDADSSAYSTATSFTTGDKVTITLDLDNEQLKLLVNDIDSGDILKGIKRNVSLKYRLMVTLCFKDSCVQIENFNGFLS